jgi:hypothetical protein
MEIDIDALQLLPETEAETGLFPCTVTCAVTCHFTGD